MEKIFLLSVRKRTLAQIMETGWFSGCGVVPGGPCTGNERYCGAYCMETVVMNHVKLCLSNFQTGEFFDAKHLMSFEFIGGNMFNRKRGFMFMVCCCTY